MLRIRLQHCRPGMALAVPVYHPRNAEVVLLRAGVALDSLSIPHLIELGISEVWIKYPGLERLMRFVDPEMLGEQRTLVASLGAALDQAFVSNTVEVDFYDCRRAVTSIIRRMWETRECAVWMGQVAGADRPFVRHCGNVAYLSMLMGMRLDFYLVRERPRLSPARAKDLTSLGVGALFHDIGMLRLAPDAVAQYNSTLDDSDPAYRSHCAVGFDMVHGKLDPASAAVVLHHHQRHDGTGFPCRESFIEEPRPARAREIHVLTRICAAADLLDRLRNPAHAPGSDEKARPPLPMVRALKRLLDPTIRAWIDPVVFRALFTVTPPYPPGSLVTLSDGSDAVVTAWTPKAPCRPTVELVDLDAHTRRKRRKAVEIDLRKRRELSIAATDGQRVLEDNFEPTTDDEFDLTGLFRGGYDSAPAPTDVREDLDVPPEKRAA